MRRRQLYALEMMEQEQRAEIERQKRIQSEINARNIEHAKQQAGITFEYRHERVDSEGIPYVQVEIKAPYQIITPSDMETQQALVARSGDEPAIPSHEVGAPAAPKRRGRPPKVR